MLSFISILLLVGLALFVAVAYGKSKTDEDDATGDSGYLKSDDKASVDSEFKVEEPTPVATKKKPAAKKKAAPRTPRKKKV